MKVYIVLKYTGYGDVVICGVFSTEEKAEQFTIENPIRNSMSGPEIYSIEDWEVK